MGGDHADRNNIPVASPAVIGINRVLPIKNPTMSQRAIRPISTAINAAYVPNIRIRAMTNNATTILIYKMPFSKSPCG
jgi:hypothetical protein